MNMNLKTLSLAVVALAMTVATQAQAKMEKPVVVRFNPATGAVEQVVLNKEITSKAEAAKIAKSGNFKAIAQENIALNELDREAGASSWYWYCNYCYTQNNYAYYQYQPQYYYYGQSYTPYYSYNYNNCYYYYYSSYRDYRHGGRRNNWWR